MQTINAQYIIEKINSIIEYGDLDALRQVTNGLLQLGIVVQFTSAPDLMRATDLGIVTE